MGFTVEPKYTRNDWDMRLQIIDMVPREAGHVMKKGAHHNHLAQLSSRPKAVLAGSASTKKNSTYQDRQQ